MDFMGKTSVSIEAFYKLKLNKFNRCNFVRLV